jgi:hypothetical protein
MDQKSDSGRDLVWLALRKIATDQPNTGRNVAMKVWKWIGGILATYVVFVVLFETVMLGVFQPDFANYPMILLTTTDETGEAQTRKLAVFKTDEKIYLSAHHWPRGWYRRALSDPEVVAELNGSKARYTAVQVNGEEFDRVSQRHPLPLPVMFLMGFPPEREILRLDQATDL